MIQSSKLDSYHQYMATRGVVETTAFPPVWRLLWSVGVKLPAPPFLSFISLVLITGSCFGPLFGFGAWLLGNRGLREMSVAEALWVALITGIAFGLIMAVYYRQLARKHRLGSWSTFRYSAPRS